MKVKNQIEFIDADKKLALKKISSDSIDIIDVDEIWDGPLSGSCRWDDNEYYFFSFDQLDDSGEDRWPRKYLLINLNSEQLGEINHQNEIYKRWQKGELFTEEYSKQYKHFPMMTVEESQVIGWFDSGPDKKKNPSKFIQSYFKWKEMHGNLDSHD